MKLQLEPQPLVALNVSGTLFTVRRETLADHEWILSKIVEDEAFFWGTLHNGTYYIDQDPDAFRCLHISCESGPFFLGLPTIWKELESIKELAEFLCFDLLLKYVNGCIEECGKVKTRVEGLD